MSKGKKEKKRKKEGSRRKVGMAKKEVKELFKTKAQKRRTWKTAKRSIMTMKGRVRLGSQNVL